MSADNGIYIAKFPDGFRVAYGSCIENIDYHPIGSKERKETLKEYFGKSEVYPEEILAVQKGFEIEKEMAKEEEEEGMGFFFLEYGVCVLPYEYENW